MPGQGREATQFKPGNPGRPKGTGYRTKALLAFGDMLTGPEGEKRLKQWMKGFREQAMKAGTPAWKMMADILLGPEVLDKLDAWLERGEKRERDFLSYQIHKRATDVQRSILLTRERYLFLMAGRRAGKSTLLRDWYLDGFIQKDNCRCLYIGLTIHKAMELLWQPILDAMAELGITVAEQRRTDGEIVTDGGGLMKFGGTTSNDEREKNRGPYWDRVAIDESQSQKELLYLIESILAPTLIDTRGQLALTGTGPRVRGTYWEALFVGAWPDGRSLYAKALRLNWSLEDNPYIPDHDKVLAEIRAEKSLSETDPLYVREYLGRIAYDDDALVLRMRDANWYTDADLAAWIEGQPVTDIRFEGGLDVGFEDADSLAIVCYSTSKPERWLVYEYKARRTGTDELAGEVRRGLQYVETAPLFAKVERKRIIVYTDTGGLGKKVGFDLSLKGLPIQDAYKADKDLGLEMLQEEVRSGMFKVRKGGPFDDEALKTVFARNEQDQLTRLIDDEAYHPDMLDAVKYAMRPIWMFQRRG